MRRHVRDTWPSLRPMILSVVCLLAIAACVHGGQGTPEKPEASQTVKVGFIHQNSPSMSYSLASMCMACRTAASEFTLGRPRT